MSEFQKRLHWCLKHGNMTVADLKHWFDRPYPTVRMWVVEPRAPRGPSGTDANKLLLQLEKKIRGGLVIPSGLSLQDRPTYVKRLRNGQRSGVPAAHSAG